MIKIKNIILIMKKIIKRINSITVKKMRKILKKKVN